MSVIVKNVEYDIGSVHNLSEITEIFRNENGRLCFKTKCILCGKEKSVRATDFDNDKFTSCSCQNMTHGMSKTKLYSVYSNMKDRCYRETHHEYKNYGGKGIIVCDEWINSFENFMNWSYANGYEEGLTIDRIDENGNYEPSNCQWITRSENTIKANKTCQHRKANKGKYYGISPDGDYYEFDNANQFSKEHGFNAGTVRYAANNDKVRYGWKFGFVNETN